MYGFNVVFLQETKIASPSDSFLKSIGGTFITSWCFLNSLGASGGQLIGWSDNIFDCTSELIGEFLLSVKLTNRRTGQHFVVTSVYGPCTEGCLAAFW